jgi:hypothetical protein
MTGSLRTAGLHPGIREAGDGVCRLAMQECDGTPSVRTVSSRLSEEYDECMRAPPSGQAHAADVQALLSPPMSRTGSRQIQITF